MHGLYLQKYCSYAISFEEVDHLLLMKYNIEVLTLLLNIEVSKPTFIMSELSKLRLS